MTPSLPSGDSNKGFMAWLKRPENKTTAMFFAAIGVAAFWFWGLIVPFVVATLANTFLALAYGAALFFVLTSKTLHKALRMANRWFTGWFVSLDPIGIRKDHIAEIKKRKEEANEAIGSIRGLGIANDNALTANKQKYQLAMGRLTVARKIINSPAQYNAEAQRQAQRCMTTDGDYATGLQRLMDNEEKQKAHYVESVSRLTRLGESCDDMIARKQHEIELQEENLRADAASKKARGAMWKIFGAGGGAEQEMDDMAREQLEAEHAEEMGQFDQFLSLTSDIVAKDDFSKLAALEQIQSKIDNFANQSAVPTPTLDKVVEYSTTSGYFSK